MSLSKDDQHAGVDEKFLKGKVIMGHGQKSVTLRDLQDSRKRPNWDETTSEEYMNRVRAKATAKAKEILELAEAEAEHLRNQGYEKGYNEGIAQAQQELVEAQQQMDQGFSMLLQQVQQAAQDIYTDYRAELITLVQAATERIVGIQLDEHGQEITAQLLHEAVEAMTSRRDLVIHVHPDSQPDMQALLERVQQSIPSLTQWQIKANHGLQPGGLMIENDIGMVDNTLESRFAVVYEILGTLTLPPRQPEQENPVPDMEQPA